MTECSVGGFDSYCKSGETVSETLYKISCDVHPDDTPEDFYMKISGDDQEGSADKIRDCFSKIKYGQDGSDVDDEIEKCFDENSAEE